MVDIMNKYIIGLVLVLFMFSIGSVCAGDMESTYELADGGSNSPATFTDLKITLRLVKMNSA